MRGVSREACHERRVTRGVTKGVSQEVCHETHDRRGVAYKCNGRGIDMYSLVSCGCECLLTFVFSAFSGC